MSLSQAPSSKVQWSSKIHQTLHLFASKHSPAEEWQLGMNLGFIYCRTMVLWFYFHLCWTLLFHFHILLNCFLLWSFQEHAVISFFSFLIRHVFAFHFSFLLEHVITFTFHTCLCLACYMCWPHLLLAFYMRTYCI